MDIPRRPTIASLDMAGASSGAWQRACLDLADAYPRYQYWWGHGEKRHATGRPNYFHILGACLKAGFPLVTGDNYQQALAAVRERAQALEKGEPEPKAENKTAMPQPTYTRLDPTISIQE